jgi:acyl carrier protein
MQSRDEIYAWVTGVLCREFQLEPEDLHPGTHLVDDLDLDSIDAIDLAVRLEEQTGLALAEREIKSVRTIQDIVDIVHGRL